MTNIANRVHEAWCVLGCKMLIGPVSDMVGGIVFKTKWSDNGLGYRIRLRFGGNSVFFPSMTSPHYLAAGRIRVFDRDKGMWQ